MIRVLCTALALLVPIAAHAHCFWLEPETHTPKSGEAVNVDFKVGDIGKKASDWGLYWERIGASRLFGLIGETDEQRTVEGTTTREPGGVKVTVSEPGTHILAFASTPSFSDFEAQRFNRYVEHQGLKAIAAHRAKRGLEGRNGTELYARRAKTLLQVGEQKTNNISKPIGQTLEIVPLANPFDFEEAKQFPVKVLWRGQPLAGASLMVARGGAEQGVEEVFPTNQDGLTAFEYHPNSRYLLSVVWGEPAPNDNRADYYTIFASLTF